jgi:glycosyltransferase involved in cell wall biosynthesis
VTPVTRLGYLVGRYPAASHAFLLREVGALRRAGAEVETITIRPPRKEELLTEADRDAAGTTYRVLPAGPLKLLVAHVPAFSSHPLRYLRTLAYAIGLGRGLRGRLWQLFYFAESIVVWRHCKRLGLSRLHAHFADTATDSALLAAHFEPDWRWSISVHGPDEFAEASQNRLAEKLTAAEFVVAVSDDAKRKAEEALRPGDRGKIHTVRMGLDLGRFAPSTERRAVGDTVSVLCLGRLVERKGHRFLIEAIAGIEGMELVIAGDGPERRNLEELAKSLGVSNRIEFAGLVGQDEALELYHHADVFCLPSLAEGLPTVLIEAMACGVAVVSTRIDGVPELISDGEDGLLCEAGDPGALAAALQRLVGDPAERERLGRAGRAKVERLHDLDRQAAALLLLLAGTPGDPLPAEAGGVGELPDAEQSKA